MTGLTECGEGRGSNPTPARGRAPSPGRQAFAADCTDCRPACRSPLVVDGAVPAGSEGASCVVPLAARWFFFLGGVPCRRLALAASGRSSEIRAAALLASPTGTAGGSRANPRRCCQKLCSHRWPRQSG